MDCLPICWPRAPTADARPRRRAPQRGGPQRRAPQRPQLQRREPQRREPPRARQIQDEEQRLERQRENLRRVYDATAADEGRGYSIDLCSRALTDDCLAQILARALAQTPGSVTALCLGNNKLTSRAAAELAPFLRTQSSVTELDLRGNNIGDRGLEALLEGLMGDTAVQRVDLRRVGITDQGAQTLGTLLENNRAITSLDLRNNNRITSRGVGLIVDALEKSGNPVDVNLAYLGDKGTQARLAAVLERNRFLSRRILSLTWEPPVGGSLQVRCHGMDGSEVASELVRVSDTLHSLKELLAQRLDLHPRRMALVLPDARLLLDESPEATLGKIFGV